MVRFTAARTMVTRVEVEKNERYKRLELVQ